MEKKLKDEWKKRLDTLRAKLDLGKDDLKEGLEDLEKDLSAYLSKIKTEIDGFVEDNEKAQQMKARLEEMRLQMALAKADGREALEVETRKLRDKLHAWKWDAIDWLKEKTDEQSGRVREALDEELEFYTAQLELINVRAHLGKEEAKDKWDKLKDDLSVKLQELKAKVENQAEDRWDGAKKDFAGQLRKWADRME
jgi:glycyl-tRNA synthetase (class II)